MKKILKNVLSWREMNCSFSLLMFISLSTWTASRWWGPLIALISGEGYVCSWTAVIARNVGYQDIQAWFMSSAFWTEASSWAYLHSGGEPSKAVGLTNQWLYQQEWEQEASHSQQSFLCKCRASPSVAGCKERHANVWSFQLLSPFLSSLLLQQPPRWDTVAHWTNQRRITRGPCKKTDPKYSCPEHLGTCHAAVGTQGRGKHRQLWCWEHLWLELEGKLSTAWASQRLYGNTEHAHRTAQSLAASLPVIPVAASTNICFKKSHTKTIFIGNKT